LNPSGIILSTNFLQFSSVSTKFSRASRSAADRQRPVKKLDISDDDKSEFNSEKFKRVKKIFFYITSKKENGILFSLVVF